MKLDHDSITPYHVPQSPVDKVNERQEELEQQELSQLQSHLPVIVAILMKLGKEIDKADSVRLINELVRKSGIAYEAGAVMSEYLVKTLKTLYDEIYIEIDTSHPEIINQFNNLLIHKGGKRGKSTTPRSRR